MGIELNFKSGDPPAKREKAIRYFHEVLLPAAAREAAIQR